MDDQERMAARVVAARAAHEEAKARTRVARSGLVTRHWGLMESEGVAKRELVTAWSGRIHDWQRFEVAAIAYGQIVAEDDAVWGELHATLEQQAQCAALAEQNAAEHDMVRAGYDLPAWT